LSKRVKVLKKGLRNRIICERRIQETGEADILMAFYIPVVKNIAFWNAK